MSAFVLPGLGQFVNKHILKGILVFLGTIAPFISLIVYVVYFYVTNLNNLMNSVSDNSVTELPFASISIPLVIALFLTSLFFYFYGAIDAYLVAAKLRQAEMDEQK